MKNLSYVENETEELRIQDEHKIILDNCSEEYRSEIKNLIQIFGNSLRLNWYWFEKITKDVIFNNDRKNNHIRIDCPFGMMADVYNEFGLKSILYRRQLWNDFVSESGKLTVDEVSSMLSHIARPYRSKYLYQILTSKRGDKLTNSQVWNLIKETWSNVESVSQDEYWSYIFSLRKTPPRYKREIQKSDKFKFIDGDKYFFVYRGGHPMGLSWTLDEDTAKWFANRNGRVGDNNNVHMKMISIDEVKFYTNDRNEEEVVIVPSNETHDIREIEYSPRKNITTVEYDK